MEKLQVILAHARKHHFWLLCIVVVVLALVGWTQASSHLSSAYTEQVRKVNDEFEKVKRVSSEEHPPNERWKSEVDKMVLDLREKVYALWKQEHAQQKEEILQWPTELGPKFLDFVRNNGPNEEIPRDLCQKYYYYVRMEFPKLREIIKAQNPEDEREQGAAGGGLSRFSLPGSAATERRATKRDEGAPVRKEKTFIVEWNPSDQRRIYTDLDPQNSLSSKDVRNLQEDLWVYRALLRAIANVNDSVTGQFNAKVKRLDRMAIGVVATDQFKAGNASGQVYVPPKPAGAPGTTDGAAVSGATGNMAGGGDAATGADQSPDAGRYVDAQGKPLVTQAEQAELKRMPVYLKLVMDQRHIHRLLAECANSPLPIEVRQLRVKSLQTVPGGGTLFDLAAAARGGGMMPGMAGGGRFSMGGASGRPNLSERFPVGGAAGGRPFGASAPTSDSFSGSDKEENPNDVDVELHGIICIFNPPDRTKLDMVAAAAGQESGAPSTDGQPPAKGPAGTEQPAAAPPAAGAVAPMNPVPAAPEAAPEPPRQRLGRQRQSISHQRNKKGETNGE